MGVAPIGPSEKIDSDRPFVLPVFCGAKNALAANQALLLNEMSEP
jgi:hypothetical protein